MPSWARNVICHGFDLACYAVLMALVLLPWATGMEPQEFWGW